MTTACNFKRLEHSYNCLQVSERAFNSGWALCNHTNIVNGRSTNQRSEVGDLVYAMKYRQSLVAMHQIAETMAHFVIRRLQQIGAGPDCFAAIIPVPPTADRLHQPVIELARTVSAMVGIPCDTGLLVKHTRHEQMKKIKGYSIKRAILKDAMSVTDQRYAGKRVLVLDDIIDSGATLDTSADILKRHGGVATVSVLCATYTHTQQQ